jgi:pSer/pThr/pTyr-binding forkhead associated (FHA) protein
MSEASVVKLRLALMGRPVRNYTFDKQLISVGRDPESDVFVDNPGVSRDHFRLERTASGEYQVVDLGSANGTFVNDQSIRTVLVHNNDVVRFGKYTLWVGYEHDRRSMTDDAHRAAADTEQHTLVLSRSELASVLTSARQKEAAPASSVAPDATLRPATVAPPAASTPVAAVIVAFLLGAALGAGAVWLLLQR